MRQGNYKGEKFERNGFKKVASNNKNNSGSSLKNKSSFSKYKEDKSENKYKENKSEGKYKENRYKENKFKENRYTQNDSEKINKEVREDLIEGRNAVIESLKSERTIEQILVAKGDTEGSITVVMALAKDKGIIVKEVDRKKLDSMSETGSHQGVIAITTPYKYCEVDEILSYADSKGEKPFIIILDEIEDPHNLGSIIRTAEVCGVHGIIIPKRRNVGVTSTVYKSSAGAIEHVKVAKVTNINTTIDSLKGKGIWIYGADMSGENFCFDTDFSGAIAMVIGSEGNGISKLTKEKCDVLVKIPMMGKINSLNASVAGGIIMYEILKQKIKRG